MSDNSKNKIGLEVTVTYKLMVNLDSDSDEIIVPALTLKKHNLAKLLDEQTERYGARKTAKRWRNWFLKFKKEHQTADSIRIFVQSGTYNELPSITKDKVNNYLNETVAKEKKPLAESTAAMKVKCELCDALVLPSRLERHKSKTHIAPVSVVTLASAPSANVEFISYKSKSRFITDKCVHCGKSVVPGSKSCYFCDL
jgi:ribosomal protein S27E